VAPSILRLGKHFTIVIAEMGSSASGSTCTVPFSRHWESMADNDAQSFPDRAATALLLIDVINDLEFEDGAELLVHAIPMAQRIAALKRRASDAGVPVIYLNDNFGQWRSDFRAAISRIRDNPVRGHALLEWVEPEPEDYFVLKPKHSGFFGTTLETLLHFLGARHLILTGLTTDMCVLFTAMDAYMRDYRISVPRDAVAASRTDAHEAAIGLLHNRLRMDVTPSDALRF